MNKSVLLIMLLLCLLSCNDKKESVVPQQVLDCNLKKTTSLYKLSEMCDSISLIHLDTRADVVVGNIDKLLVNKNGIFISSNNKIFRFDWHGKYINTINKRGRSISEYIELDDFCVLDSGDILISDAQSQKINIYNIDGVFKKTLRVSFNPESIASISNSVVVKCSGTEGKRIRILDVQSEKELNGYFDYKDAYSIPLRQAFVNSHDEIYYREPYGNEYYAINQKGEMYKKYLLDFHEYNINTNDLKMVSFLGVRVLSDSKGNVDITHFFEMEEWYITEFECAAISEDSQFILFASKDKSKQYLLNSDNYEDDMLFYDYVILPQFYTTYEDYIVGVIYPAAWKDSMKEVNSKRARSNQYEKMKTIVDDIAEFQNPIIALYRINLSK